MTIAWVDFETRSRCDLKTKGVYNYAQDISTDVLCMAYAIDDAKVQLWLPGQPLPDFTGMQIRAHNAAFERLIFWYVLQQNYPLEAFYCTAAQARSNCLPGSLEDVGRAVSSKMQKDYRGTELIRKLSIPRKDGTFNNDVRLLEEMYAYCMQDVRVMRSVSKGMRDMTAEELADYHVNERINDRGVLVDVELCNAAMAYSIQESGDITRQIKRLSNNAFDTVRSNAAREWVYERLPPEAQKLMMITKKGETEPKMSMDKAVRESLFEYAKENPEEIHADVQEIIEYSDAISSSSVAKFSRLAGLADEEDHRVRGAFVFAGGSATGRASSYGAQVHNFTRECADDPLAVRAAMVGHERLVPRFGLRTTDILKRMLRPSLTPKPDHVFVVADWSAIEGRVTPWLANSPAGEEKLDIFRQKKDPYKVNAASTYNVDYADVTKAQRQVGKVQELALGFAGGAGAFDSMGRAYGLSFSKSNADAMVRAWRNANPWAMPYWEQLEQSYMAAMRNPGKIYTAGRTHYMKQADMLWYQLPSGRVLCYPYPKFNDAGNITYVKAAWKPAKDAVEWPRGRLWRGLACENITQATAHDLLRHCLRHIDGVVLHVHDEVCVECHKDTADETKERLERIMCDAPAWAEGLPLAVEATIMTRYGK